jgi:hypothetical protein
VVTVRRDALRTFALFGKRYWWDRQRDGKLSLKPVTW